MRSFSSLLAHRASLLRPSPIRKLVPLMRLPGMISFGGGYPNPSTFAFEQLRVTFRSGRSGSIAGEELNQASQYGPTTGAPDLVDRLIDWHQAKDGVRLEKDQLLVLNGSQEGLHILAYLLVEPGDTIAMSEPAYPGALAAFRAFDARLLTYPVDGEGSVVAELERALEDLQQRGEPLPKFIYEVPSGHNPAGVDMTLERRKQLLRVASRFDLLVVEDDPYQLVNLDGHQAVPTLQALDTEKRVVRLDSFSKIFAPGLRIGYASGPAEIIRAFQLYKQTSNLHTSSMDQALVLTFLTQHTNEEFFDLIRSNCELYKANRDVMVEAVQEFLPEASFEIPGSGMFLWMQLAEDVDTGKMIEGFAQEARILMVPGEAFAVHRDLSRFVRASFSMVAHQQVKEGMKRVASMLQAYRQARHG